MALTLQEAKDNREAALIAYRAALAAQSYTIGTRSLTRVSVEKASAEFAKWDRIVAQMEAGRGGGIDVFRVVPRDA